MIEFANVQLLELRYEDLLTRHMDRMYDDIQKVDKDSVLNAAASTGIMSRLMEFIADISEVTEKIDNFIKITEDIYYALVYQMTLKVLRAEQWSESVNRKLQVIQQNYARSAMRSIYSIPLEDHHPLAWSSVFISWKPYGESKTQGRRL